MSEKKNVKISLILSDNALQDYLVLMLIGEDYEVKTYSNQDSALADLEKNIPDLIISEFQTTEINGLDICKALRKNFLFHYIPIIFILSDADQLNKAKITYAGADDYLIKSSIENELLLRVKLNIYRIAREQDINPLTKLPGQASFCRELLKRIESKGSFALYYADIQQFKRYNQRYGFKRGDEVIKSTASIIINTLKTMGSSSDFVAHPQDDDFFFISMTDSIEVIAQRVIRDFDKTIPSYYDEEDKIKGYFAIKNRKGEFEKVPFLRIYISALASEYYPMMNPAQITQIASEINSFAKANFDKSMFIKERRRNYPFY
ncbi:MAG: response regulator [Candidatus Omnitrophota bacterium]|nr:diguanylate cyclase [Candidatus Omnitrophota bacterium]